MWIEYTETTSTGRPAVTALTVDGERVTFSDNGKANVSAALGRRLVAQSDAIVASGDDAPADDDSDESDAAERTDENESDETASDTDDTDPDTTDDS